MIFHFEYLNSRVEQGILGLQGKTEVHQAKMLAYSPRYSFNSWFGDSTISNFNRETKNSVYEHVSRLPSRD